MKADKYLRRKGKNNEGGGGGGGVKIEMTENIFPR